LKPVFKTTLGGIAVAEIAMLDVGIRIEPGSGVAAAQNYWRSNLRIAGTKKVAVTQNLVTT
jgi:alanine-glyoxylate transaminase / serine-glyoxylate transaminase / serine-pyruvate transaminase